MVLNWTLSLMHLAANTLQDVFYVNVLYNSYAANVGDATDSNNTVQVRGTEAIHLCVLVEVNN